MTVEDFLQAFGPDALEICRALHKNGHESGPVGGCVRDWVLGRPMHDIDLSTSAHPSTVQALFRRTYIVGQGLKHGTVGVLGSEGKGYEVTTYRRDVNPDGRHAEVEFTAQAEEDLLRRDFTMNAMMLRYVPPRGDAPEQFECIDPFGGRRDLERGLIRAVGNPAERFEEDYLRILRAYRFAARYGFEIEAETRESIRNAAAGLSQISKERIRDEFKKMLADPGMPGGLAQALTMMQQDGVLREVLPELDACAGVEQNAYHRFDVFTHIVTAADAARFVQLPGDADRFQDPEEAAEYRARLGLAVLFHDIGKPGSMTIDEKGVRHFYGNKEGIPAHETLGAKMAYEICQRWKMSNAERDWITALVRLHMRLPRSEAETTGIALKNVRKDLEAERGLKIDETLTVPCTVDLFDLIRMRGADEAGKDAHRTPNTPWTLHATAVAERSYAEATAFRKEHLAIGGKEIMQILGIQPGPQIGEVLQYLLERVRDQGLPNTPEALCTALQKRKEKSERKAKHRSP